MDSIRPSYRAFRLLHFGFMAAPIIAGIDKFTNVLTHWPMYLSPLISQRVNAEMFMKGVGGVEIAVGVLAIVQPRLAGYVIAFWMWAIILNLLSIPGYYDIALRDFGLSLGALALSQLAKEFHAKPVRAGG